MPEVCKECNDRLKCIANNEPEYCCDECENLMERFQMLKVNE